jgi:hypothetical protein
MVVIRYLTDQIKTRHLPVTAPLKPFEFGFPFREERFAFLQRLFV